MILVVVHGVPQASAASPPFRAFSAGSWWNTPLPPDAPLHPESDEIISFLKSTNVEDGCVLLAGSGDDRWGTPVYWAEPTDPTYTVATTRYWVPPEFSNLRIPRDAKPSRNSDMEMTIYDLEAGYVAWVYRAVYDTTTDTWTAGGGSVAYLDSNGLEGKLTESDEPRNTGSHRGLNGALTQARYDNVQAGAINHVLRIGVTQNRKGQWVFPMTGTDGRSDHPHAPPQGTRLRISSDIDLSDYALHPDARVIAEALQRYGAVVGDSTGAPVELKLEDTVSQGRGQQWTLGKYDLCSIPLDVFEVIEHEYTAPSEHDEGATDRDAERAFARACPSVEAASFNDVPEESVHHEAISCLRHWGIAQGSATGGFLPGASVNRGHMASFLVRLLTLAGTDLPLTGETHFPDVTGTVHSDPIGRLADAGLVNGHPDGSYRPHDLVTRGQVAALLSRTITLLTGTEPTAQPTQFVDIADTTHVTSIEQMSATGIMTGVTGTNYAPEAAMTRAQMASSLARVLEFLIANEVIDAPS